MVKTANLHRLGTGTLLRLDLWGDVQAFAKRFEAAFGSGPPDAGRCLNVTGGRIVRTEPRVWWLMQPVAEIIDPDGLVGEDGAVTDISGGWSRITIDDPQWRDRLMIGGVFDAESPAFTTDCTAGTLIEHIPVRLDVVSDTCVDVYVASSYARYFLDIWAAHDV